MQLLYRLYCSILLFTIEALTVNEEYQLLFVQIIYRHGDRAPVRLYPTDPNPASVWPRGLNELTLLGKKQHFGLGKLFRSMYENFTTFNPQEIDVLSSHKERCLESAAVNLASFFAPGEEWKFHDDLNWQPIPIHYYPKNDDKYLFTRSHCPRSDLELRKSINSTEAQSFMAKYKDALYNVTVNSGYPVKDSLDWWTLLLLRDTIWIEKRYNLTIPDWVEDNWNDLMEFTESMYEWYYKSPITKRLRAGPLIGKLIERMEEKINGSVPHLKFQVYSTHDNVVYLLLHSLNLMGGFIHPYCSSVILELYKGTNQDHFLRLLYLNSTEPEKVHQTPHVLRLDGCEEFCPLDFFVNYTRDLIPLDWKEECQILE